MARIRLRDIVSPGDRAAVMGLRRGPGQDQYLNSMEEIFAKADEEQRAMPHPWAVHDAALVGRHAPITHLADGHAERPIVFDRQNPRMH